MIAEPLYLRGALIAYSPRARSLANHLAYIPFRFNPESISRTLSASQGAQPAPQNEGKPSADSAQTAGSVSGNASTGSFSESFTLTLRFDVHERDKTVALLPPALGVAPELAALESLLAPVKVMDVVDKLGNSHPASPEPPLLVFVWGARVTPVRVTNMTIKETLYNAFLNPVRAEVDVALAVISQTDMAQSGFIRGIHQAMAVKRDALARGFLANTVAQGGGILPL